MKIDEATFERLGQLLIQAKSKDERYRERARLDLLDVMGIVSRDYRPAENESATQRNLRGLWWVALLAFFDIYHREGTGREVTEAEWKKLENAVAAALEYSAFAAADDLRQRVGLPAAKKATAPMEPIAAVNPWVASHRTVLKGLAAQMAADAVLLVMEAVIELRYALGLIEAILEDPAKWERYLRHEESTMRNHAEQVELAKPEIGAQFPFAQYVTMRDERVRDRKDYRHRPFEGLVAARSWSGWPKCRPPNGHNCRCGVRYVTRIEAKARGWLDKQGNPTFTVKWPSAQAKRYFESGEFPDKGFHGPKFWAASTAKAKPVKAAG
jgi:hypothetical protein